MVFSEHPGFTALVDQHYADRLGIPRKNGLPEHSLSAPLDVHLTITTRCNLSCFGCHVSGPSVPNADMDIYLARGIVSHLAQMGVFTIALGGGEPLLYPYVFDLAHFIREQEVVPTITTNGTLIDSKEAALLCRVFGNVHLSLHDTVEAERLEPPIRNLQAAGIRPGLNVLLTSRTIEHLQGIFRWAAHMNTRELLLLRYKATRACKVEQWSEITVEQERALWPRVRDLARRHGIIPMLDCSLFPALAVHRLPLDHLRRSDVAGCQGGNAYIAVDVHGGYRPCSFWPESLGDSLTLSPEEWKGGAALNAVRRPIHSTDCTQCAYLLLCNGGCPLVRGRPCLQTQSSR